MGVATTHYTGAIPLQVTYVESIQTVDSQAPKVTKATRSILQHSGLGAGDSYALTVCGTPIHAEIPEVGVLVSPFFYHDNQNAFYVEPWLTETTIDRWEHWAIPHPHKVVLRRLKIVPSVPRYMAPHVLPAGSRAFDGLFDPSARFHLETAKDSITHGQTPLHYGSYIVGESGGLAALTTRAPASSKGAPR
jgi:hypothetical protein